MGRPGLAAFPGPAPAQRIEGLPVTMLLAGRPADPAHTEAGALWAQLAARPDAVALYPRPLSQAAAVAWTRDQLGTEAADEFCRACHTATGGNPLFLRELLRALDVAARPPLRLPRRPRRRRSDQPRSGVLYCIGWPCSGPHLACWPKPSRCSGDESELAVALRPPGLAPDEARGAADDLVRADIFVPAGPPGLRAPDRAAGAVRGSRTGRTARAARRGCQLLAAEGAPAGVSPRTCC